MIFANPDKRKSPVNFREFIEWTRRQRREKGEEKKGYIASQVGPTVGDRLTINGNKL